MKFFAKNAKEKDEQYTVLLQNLAQTKAELDCAYSNFSNVTEPDLIDAYIYQLNSVQIRYRVLLNRVKEYRRAAVS